MYIYYVHNYTLYVTSFLGLELKLIQSNNYANYRVNTVIQYVIRIYYTQSQIINLWYFFFFVWSSRIERTLRYPQTTLETSAARYARLPWTCRQRWRKMTSQSTKMDFGLLNSTTLSLSRVSSNTSTHVHEYAC